MNAVRSNNLYLKYQRFTSSGCKDIGFTKIELVAKTQFLSRWYCQKWQLLAPLTIRYPMYNVYCILYNVHIYLTYSRIGLELWGSRAIGEATHIQMESIKSKRKVNIFSKVFQNHFYELTDIHRSYFSKKNFNHSICR